MTHAVLDESDTALNACLDALRVPDCGGLENKIRVYVRRRSMDGLFSSFVRIAAVFALFCVLGGFYVGYARVADADVLAKSSLNGYLTDLFESAPYMMEL